MRIGNILANYISLALVYLGLLANDLDAFAARAGRWLHDVHVLVASALSLDAELAVVVGEDVRLWTEVELVAVALEHARRSLDVLPHQILSPKLEALREMVDLLVLGHFLELLEPAHSTP